MWVVQGWGVPLVKSVHMPGISFPFKSGSQYFAEKNPESDNKRH
jgi:hypothetical protein